MQSNYMRIISTLIIIITICSCNLKAQRDNSLEQHTFNYVINNIDSFAFKLAKNKDGKIYCDTLCGSYSYDYVIAEGNSWHNKKMFTYNDSINPTKFEIKKLSDKVYLKILPPCIYKNFNEIDLFLQEGDVYVKVYQRIFYYDAYFVLVRLRYKSGMIDGTQVLFKYNRNGEILAKGIENYKI